MATAFGRSPRRRPVTWLDGSCSTSAGAGSRGVAPGQLVSWGFGGAGFVFENRWSVWSVGFRTPRKAPEGMESEASETGAMCIQLCTSLPVFGKSLESLSFWSFVAADVCQHAPALQRGRSLFTHYGWSVFSTRSGDITGSQAKVLGFSIEKDCSFIAIYIFIYRLSKLLTRRAE